MMSRLRIKGHPFISYRILSISIITLVSLSFATGCYDRKELEQQAFVTSLGVDKAPDGMIDCTLRIAIPTSSGQGGGQSGGEPLAATGPVTYRAKSIAQALSIANSSVERTISLSHLTEIVFGVPLAEQGLRKYLDPMLRYREFRRTTHVAVAQPSARDVMVANQPMVEKSKNRVPDDIALAANTDGMIIESRVHDFVSSLAAVHESPLMTVLSVNKAVKADPEGKQGVTSATMSSNPGETARAGGNPMEWNGAALFRGDKMVRMLSGDQTMLIRLLQGDLKNAKMDFANPLGESIETAGTAGRMNTAGHAPTGQDAVSLSLRRERQPTYRVDMTNPLAIQVEVPLDAEILEFTGKQDITDPVVLRKLEQGVDEQLARSMGTLVTQLFHDDEVDCIPISRAVRRRFSTYLAFEKYPWEKELKTAKVNIQVNIHVRRLGSQLGTLHPQV